MSSTVFALPCRVPSGMSVARRVVLALLFAAGIVLLGWVLGDRAQAAEPVGRQVAVTVETVVDTPQPLPQPEPPARVLPEVTAPEAVDTPEVAPPVVRETPDVPDELPLVRVTVPQPPIAVDDVVELPSSALPRVPLPVEDAGTDSSVAARPEPPVAPTSVQPVAPVDVTAVPPTAAATAPSDAVKPPEVGTPAHAKASQLAAPTVQFVHVATSLTVVDDTTQTPRPQGPAHTPALPDGGTTFDVSHRVGNPLLGTLSATPAAASRPVTTSSVGTPAAVALDRPEEVQVSPA